MPEKVNAYAPAEGQVTLFHSELDVTMDVPPEAVEIWERSGWTKATAKVAKAAEDKEA